MTDHACLKMVTLFSARLCVLFTKNCSLYREVNKVRLLMESDSVVRRIDLWSVMILRRLTWAIVTDCREFFARHVTPDEFREAEELGSDVVFPQLGLFWVMENLKQLREPVSGDFPESWLTKAAKGKGGRGQEGERNSSDGAGGGGGRGRGRGGGRQ